GNASSVVTRMVSVVDDFRRNGSRNTAKPEATGNKPIKMPMAVANIFLKKPRRSGWGLDSCECISSIQCDFQTCAHVPEKLRKRQMRIVISSAFSRTFRVLLLNSGVNLR